MEKPASIAAIMASLEIVIDVDILSSKKRVLSPLMVRLSITSTNLAKVTVGPVSCALVLSTTQFWRPPLISYYRVHQLDLPMNYSAHLPCRHWYLLHVRRRQSARLSAGLYRFGNTQRAD